MAVWQRVPYGLLLHLWYHVGDRSCGGQGSSQSSWAATIRQHGFHSWIVASDAHPHIPQGVCRHPGQWLLCPQGNHRVEEEGCFCKRPDQVTEFRQPLQVQSHLEMPGILVQLGHIQRT